MKSGSISKTANTLSRTQPAISLSIKNLEEKLGFKLFERQGRQLIAVPEAFYFLGEATKILEKTYALERTMSSLQNAKTGNLNVSAMPGPASYLFPRFISNAIGENTDIRVSITSRSSVQIHELAATQSIDFGFADSAPAREDSQYIEEVITASCFCAIPASHPMATQSDIHIKDLDMLPMGGLQSTHFITQKLLTAFEEESSTFNKIVDSQTYLPLLQFVSAEQCFVIVDPLTVVTEIKTGSTGGRVVFRPIVETLRYSYAVLSPSFRPMSQIASRIKQDWITKVLQLLEAIQANPSEVFKDNF